MDEAGWGEAYRLPTWRSDPGGNRLLLLEDAEGEPWNESRGFDHRRLGSHLYVGRSGSSEPGVVPLHAVEFGGV